MRQLPAIVIAPVLLFPVCLEKLRSAQLVLKLHRFGRTRFSFGRLSKCLDLSVQAVDHFVFEGDLSLEIRFGLVTAAFDVAELVLQRAHISGCVVTLRGIAQHLGFALVRFRFSPLVFELLLGLTQENLLGLGVVLERRLSEEREDKHDGKHEQGPSGGPDLLQVSHGDALAGEESGRRSLERFGYDGHSPLAATAAAGR